MKAHGEVYTRAARGPLSHMQSELEHTDAWTLQPDNLGFLILRNLSPLSSYYHNIKFKTSY